ncbi:hypothetical protein PP7435_CHR1-1116 [Komagataella phaffii CBS 7435]|uniref:5-hydroxyisourate hydrolase n=2 Tax=Komagataella phaffii TaxID=460519 RepID=C4QY49_KOMPG|nr:Hypothetical protein PAS_chr1-4_0329 [Komagataella phaffii GS115]AOA61003.1 GQ67_01841T0 [Komagataella phaffii]CAH2446992.1 hypothetical protein BQ9382_C1-5865 [Komagataella phaffii CBS 7435]AOA65471.1 GQ68_01856T0 [Komagataella phaffii GS115]CAY68172.1 Hypothetical protein PAS_chr1-4_0329 [Komagataella phaffii GS115]CCA37246.1 hypothetical protein PP7435_CHR1-1116 [Komagataella phaffii CBS 7435]
MADPVTCHILDTTKGKPAFNVDCAIFQLSPSVDVVLDNEIGNERPFAVAKTNEDGRIPYWIIDPKLSRGKQEVLGIKDDKWKTLTPGIYKIRFHVKKYFQATGTTTFFPFVDIIFQIDDPPENHYHIPLLLSNHSYTTYRGS